MIAADGTERRPVPRLLVAVTRHVCVLPAVRSVTVIGFFLPDLLLVTPPSDEAQVAVKLVIGAPLPDGALNFTFSDPEPTFDTVGFGGGPDEPTLIATKTNHMFPRFPTPA